MGSTNIIDHLQEHLGRIEEIWTSQTGTTVQVARFGGRAAGGVAFATFGLSNHELAVGASDRMVRQELLMLVPPDRPANPVPGLLRQVAESALTENSAIRRGQVIGTGGPVLAGSTMEALYVTLPVYLPDQFATAATEAGKVAISWLVPITPAEAAFVVESGWGAFEERLERRQPDLVNPRRKSVV